MKITALNGTEDIYGQNARIWQKVEQVIHEMCADFFIDEIRTPIFEHTELFCRGVGETTDIVQKEMYTFTDRGGRSLTLKPETTAGVARAFVERGMINGPMPMKLYYIAPSFRAERPQKGRNRQFHQFGVECFGSTEPVADAEVISVAYEFFRRLEIENVELHINSIGNLQSRKVYNEVLTGYIHKNFDSFCELCKERTGKNPLRVLDCKNPGCKALVDNAPTTLEHLLPDCLEHFEGVKRALDIMKISYIVDTNIVRGLDYYTRTVFEFISSDIGAQSTLAGGGRYDNLISEVGGGNVPAIGFAIGMERIILALDAQGKADKMRLRGKPSVFVGNVGERGFTAASSLVYELRKQGITAFMDLSSRALKAQMKYADKSNADYTVILGDDEVGKSECEVKNMANGSKIVMPICEIAVFMKKTGEKNIN